MYRRYIGKQGLFIYLEKSMSVLSLIIYLRHSYEKDWVGTTWNKEDFMETRGKQDL